MNGEGPLSGAHTDGLPATTTVAQADLQLHALALVAASRDIADYILSGDVNPEPWTAGAVLLLERASWYFEVAA